MKSFRNIRVLTLLVIIFASIAIDQFSKYWMIYEVGIVTRSPIEVTSFFSLVMLWNHGVSFGMLSRSGLDSAPYFLIAMAVIISGIMLRIALKSHAKWEWVGYGLVIGGALGNAIDRIRVGAVADFFYFHIDDLGWPAFNIADSGICIGVCILLLSMLRNSRVKA